MIRTLVYGDDRVETREAMDAETLRDARTATGTTWIRASDVTDDELDRLSTAFDLHALEIEDVVNDVRPKVETFPEHTFALLKTAELRAARRRSRRRSGTDPSASSSGTTGW
jgi:magnesium transporter